MASTMYMILCGGKGQRLWPVGRQNLPKQFIALGNQKTLLEATAARVKPLLMPNDRLGIVTSEEYLTNVQRLLGNTVDCYVIEPIGRNTAPAILLACLQIEEEQTGDPVVVFMPSDHYIKENDVLESTIKRAAAYAEHHSNVCLLGIKPRGISTSYGYIMSHDKHTTNTPSHIDTFIEKPAYDVAEILTASPYALWNCGIFIARNSVFLNAFQQACPELLQQVSAARDGKSAYEDLKGCAFDTAVTEKIANRIVFPTDITWQDLGDLESFAQYIQQESAGPSSNSISMDGNNNLALSKKKLVAFLGVSDLCIVETDDVILVKRRGEANSIKGLIGMLQDQGLENLL